MPHLYQHFIFHRLCLNGKAGKIFAPHLYLANVPTTNAAKAEDEKVKPLIIIPSTDKIVKQKMPPPGSISRFLFSFLDSGRFAGQPAQIEKFRATDNPAAFHFNLGQTR